MERRLNRMDRRLELTDEQVDIIRDTVERARARKRQLREQAKPSDVTRTRMRRIHERMRNEIREVLTPEQRQRLAEVRARPHHGPRPGH
jgi:Spy/CpxP family protein refolding chaperone